MIALPPLAQGTTFAGEYRILELLSHTNHLALYGAIHTPSGEQRVLELIFSPVVPGQAFRDRFIRAASSTSAAAGPIIPRVLAAAIDPTSMVPFIAMEPFRGEVLATASMRGGGMQAADALSLLGQVAAGLGQLHAVGVLHGGLRPEAVVLTADPTQRTAVKLINGALAKVLGDARVATAPSAVPCDPAWAAPEQIEGHEPSPASDVYSLGLLAFTVLTGQRIWRGTADAQIAREAVKDALPVPTVRAYELGRGGSLPSAFDGWFARCGARNPAERFPSPGAAFAELQLIFQRAAAQFTGSISPMTSAHLVVPPRPTPKSGAGVLLAVGGILAGVIALGALGAVAYKGVVRYQERALEARRAAEKAAASETKTSSAEVTTPEAARPEGSDGPSVDIGSLPTARSGRDRRERDERRAEARAEAAPKAETREVPARVEETSTSAATSPAALAEGKASSAPPAKLQVVDLSAGRGKAVASGDKIAVRYTAKRQADGVVYDGSHAVAPFSFTLGQGRVTKGWELGIPGMKVGGKRRLVVPPQLAYGEKGLGSAVPPNATLVFDLELVSVD